MQQWQFDHANHLISIVRAARPTVRAATWPIQGFGVVFFAEEQTLEDFCSDMTMITWPGNFDLLHLGASNFEVYSTSRDAGDLPSADVLKINEVIEPVLSRVGKSVGFTRAPLGICATCGLARRAVV